MSDSRVSVSRSASESRRDESANESRRVVVGESRRVLVGESRRLVVGECEVRAWPLPLLL